MTTATNILRHEHEAILRMLEVTELVARQLESGERVPPETLRDLLEFFSLFADRCHHGKEEDILFPLLRKRGLSHPGGPIGVMLAEHSLGRALIQQMRQAGEAYGQGAVQAGLRWAQAAMAYAALLRQHIHKENEILFRIADNLFTAADQIKLAIEFERLEEEEMGAGVHDRLHVLAEQLTAIVLSRAQGRVA